MSGNWNWPFGSKRSRSTGARPRPAANRARRRSPELVIQELERRTLLSVTASLSGTALDVNLTAANDQVLIVPSGSTIVVSGTGESGQSFSGRQHDRCARCQHFAPGRSRPERHVRGHRRHDHSGRCIGHPRLECLRRHVRDHQRRHDQRDLGQRRHRGLRDDVGSQQHAADGGHRHGRRRSPSRTPCSPPTTSRSTPVQIQTLSTPLLLEVI